MHLRGARLALAVGGLVALAGCASDRSYRVARPAPAPAYRPIAPVAPPAVAVDRGMKPGEALWHMRSALNVAALSCRDRNHRQIAANYNAMLRRHRAALAEAYAEEQAIFRARYGKDWQQRQDRHLTSLYNGFALLATKGSFCATALAISARVNDLDATQFRAYSGAALSQLEHPRAGYVARD